MSSNGVMQVGGVVLKVLNQLNTFIDVPQKMYTQKDWLGFAPECVEGRKVGILSQNRRARPKARSRISAFSPWIWRKTSSNGVMQVAGVALNVLNQLNTFIDVL